VRIEPLQSTQAADNEAATAAAAAAEDRTVSASMAAVAAAEAESAKVEFSFNPSAPEFVPQQQPKQDDDAKPMPLLHVPSEVLDEVDTASTDAAEGGGRRHSAGRRRSSVTATTPAGGTPDLRPQRQSTRRATNAAEAPSQVATLVLKNLAVDLERDDVMRFLEERGAAAVSVELHRTANGAFRGTAFARYGSPGKARAALQRLGVLPELGGRRARVEIQKSKALFGRKVLEAGLPQEELSSVREAIELFARDPSRTEMGLPADLSVHQRKYAHSLAERHNLAHATRQGEGGERFVHLSKTRGPPGEGRKKAHSIALCSTSRNSWASAGFSASARRATFSCGAEADFAAWLPEGDALTLESLAAVSPALSAVGAAPGLPLPPGALSPPGLEMEGPAWRAAVAAAGGAVLPPPLELPEPAPGLPFPPGVPQKEELLGTLIGTLH